MKKIVAAVCAAVLMVSLATPLQVSAATKDDIVDTMWAGVMVGQEKKNIPSRYVTLVARYLAANHLSASQLDEVLAAAQEVKAIWAATGETEFKDIPYAIQMQLIGRAASMAKKLGASMSFSGKILTIIDPNGKAFSVNTRHDLSIFLLSDNTSGKTPDGGDWIIEGDTIIITDKDGNVSTIQINPIKQTGAGVDTSSAIAVVALLIVGLSATVVVARKNRLDEDCE